MELAKTPPKAKSLADFDLDDIAVANIVKLAHSERMRVSTFAPSNAPGMTFYNWFVSGLRRHLVMLGRDWKKKNVNGLEVVEHEKKRIRIAYVSAANTADEHMTSSRRGPVSLEAAAVNGQMSLLPAEWLGQTRAKKTKAMGAETRPSDFETWFIAIEDASTCYRVALALPVETVGGRFVEWEHKIRLADVSLDSEPKDDAIRPAPAETTAAPRATRKKQPGNDESGSAANTG